jgi:hypothetical protein
MALSCLARVASSVIFSAPSSIAERLRLWASLALATALWLCPLWINPTPVVPPLLWGGICLGLWQLLTPPSGASSTNQPLTFLLATLGLMLTWRSASGANALAAWVCLLAIGLSAHLGRTLVAQTKADLIAWAWLLAGLINSGLALIQYAGWTAEPAGTAFGFIRQRNNMASLCMLATAALFYLCYQSQRSLRWAAPCGALLMAALAATASRTGFLQLVLLSGLLLLGFMRCKRRLAVLCLVCLVSYALAAWLLPQLIGSGESVVLRVLGTASSSADGLQLQDSRKPLWSNTWAVAVQHPLWGVGWRELAYSLQITDFGAAARFGYQADNAHNLPLQLAAELGLPFAALWLSAFALYVLYRARSTWLARQEDWQATSLLGWTALIVLGVHSLLEYPLWYAPYQVALGLALGLVAHGSHVRGTGREPWILAFAGMTVGAGVALILFCIYAAFDYHRVSQLFKPADQRSAFYQTNTLRSAEGSWLFASQVRFAKLLMMTVTPDNAQEAWQLGQQVIHFSPEPRVFKVLIAAGTLLAPHDLIIQKELAILQRQLVLIGR